MLSIVIPVFNEELAVTGVIEGVKRAFRDSDAVYEIIAVDDASTDKTSQRLEVISDVTVLSFDFNRGYGASLKHGIRQAKGEWIAITDADGTYPVEDLPKLYQKALEGKYDMVVGARTKVGAAHPIVRKPGKVFIQWLAEFLVGRKIPDLNSGLRVFKKDLAERFWKLFPERWSFTVTITLAALTNSYAVHFEPIDYRKRIGSSTMNLWSGISHDFPNFVLLIIRIVTYFKPLRFFAIPSLVIFSIGVINLLRTIVMYQNVTDASLLLILVGIQIGFLGLIADLIVKSRS